MNKVYVAAPFEARDYARRIARMLQLKGVSTTSRWIDHPDTKSHQGAVNDLDDILKADVVVVLNPEGFENTGTGGRHTELGYALGTGKPILLVGERTQMFHYLNYIKVVDSTEDITKHVLKLLGR